MNSKLILAAIVGGFFLFSGKKSSGKPIVKEDIAEEDKVDEDKVPEDNIPEKETPSYKTLTASRKKIVDSYINMSPMKTNEPAPFGDYIIWASDKQKLGIPPLYQDWLANQIYWQITKLEGKTDLYSDIMGVNPPGYDGTMPYVLQQGKKALIDPETKNLQIVDITESKAQSNKRLGKGIALWTDINKFVKANYKGCNQGAYCG